MKYGQEEFDSFWQAAMRWKNRRSFNKQSFFNETFRSPEFIGYGGASLRRVTERMDEIATMVGGLSVRMVPIEAEEKDKFAGVVDPDFLEEVSDPNTYGIGAVIPLPGDFVSKEDRFRPVGAMIFRIEKREDDGLYFAALRWLYVAKEVRCRGVASHMMEWMFPRVVGAGIEYVEVVVDPEEANRDLAEFLAGWGFDMRGAYISRILTTVKELKGRFEGRARHSMSVGKPLDQVPYDMVKRRIREIANKWGCYDMEMQIDRERRYLDENASFVSLADGKPEHMLLVAQKPSGIFSPVFLGDITKDNHDIIFGLILQAIKTVEQGYGREVPVVIEGKHKMTARLMGELFPGQDMAFVLSGVRMIEDNKIWQ